MAKQISTENKQLYDLLVKVLGFSPYGFLDGTKWKDFEDAHFFRAGTCEGENYSAHINRHVSRAAMLQTIDEIRDRIEKYFDKHSTAHE